MGDSLPELQPPGLAHEGAGAALDFFTAYLIEYSLSVDNIFVFVLIFTYFQVPPEVSAPGAGLGHHRRARHARGS